MACASKVAFCIGLLFLSQLSVTFAGRGLSQSVQLGPNSSGCLDAAPGPPTNLKATPGDGSVTLTWNKPANNACVTFYAISQATTNSLTTQYNPNGSFQQSYQQSYTVSGLQNGQTYYFVVSAVNLRYPLQGGSATTQATPRASAPPTPPSRLCTDYIRPSGPGNLKVVSVGATSVEGCWDTPTNYGCADSYNVEVTPRVKQGVGSFLDSIRVQSGKCVTVKDLAPQTEYTMTVTSYSNRFNGGGSSSVNFKTK